ncbi:DgyrCDS3450 [Dimorphilus gyrociliatus]|uniref:DgyrCDS3450 n=1 Tax=Dimorphilus gyrociliatus TaxID=2664684 RepID=A0A7I8VEC8_9ANNE|nr:DgyrCDS3450 [Dimorphilus gyrociliatus]
MSQSDRNNYETLRENDNTYTVDDAIENLGNGKYQIMIFVVSLLSWMTEGMELLLAAILGPLLICHWKISPISESIMSSATYVGFTLGSVLFVPLADKAGRLGASYSLGVFLQSVLAYFIIPNYGWRIWVAVISTITLLSFLLSLSLQESPRFTEKLGNVRKTESILKIMYKWNNKPFLKGRLLQKTAKLPKINSYAEILKFEDKFSATFLYLTWFGINLVYFGICLIIPQILKDGGGCMKNLTISNNYGMDEFGNCQVFSGKDFLYIMLSGFSEVVAAFATWLLIERVGRINMIFVDNLLTGIISLVLIHCFPKAVYVVLLCLARAFSCSSSHVIILLACEFFPTNIRSTAVGIGFFVCKIGAALSPFIGQYLVTYYPRGAIGTIGVFSLSTSLIVLFIKRDTTSAYLD